MSPIVYVPPKKHECEPLKKHHCKPPMQTEAGRSRDGDGWYPEGTIWECGECARKWVLEYSPFEVLWCGRTYSYYEINWRRVSD